MTVDAAWSLRIAPTNPAWIPDPPQIMTSRKGIVLSHYIGSLLPAVDNWNPDSLYFRTVTRRHEIMLSDRQVSPQEWAGAQKGKKTVRDPAKCPTPRFSMSVFSRSSTRAG